jgi:hypothetical protein
MISSTFLSTICCGKLVDNGFSVKNFLQVDIFHINPQEEPEAVSGNVEKLLPNI